MGFRRILRAQCPKKFGESAARKEKKKEKRVFFHSRVQAQAAAKLQKDISNVLPK